MPRQIQTQHLMLLFSRVYNITFESPIFFLLSKNQIILCWVYATGYTTGWSYSFIQSSGLDNRGLFLTITQIVQPLNQPTRVFIMYWEKRNVSPARVGCWWRIRSCQPKCTITIRNVSELCILSSTYLPMMEEFHVQKSNWAKVIHQASFSLEITQLQKSTQRKKNKIEKKFNLTLGVFIIIHMHLRLYKIIIK